MDPHSSPCRRWWPVLHRSHWHPHAINGRPLLHLFRISFCVALKRFSISSSTPEPNKILEMCQSSISSKTKKETKKVKKSSCSSCLRLLVCCCCLSCVKLLQKSLLLSLRLFSVLVSNCFCIERRSTHKKNRQAEKIFSRSRRNFAFAFFASRVCDMRLRSREHNIITNFNFIVISAFPCFMLQTPKESAAGKSASRSVA